MATDNSDLSEINADKNHGTSGDNVGDSLNSKDHKVHNSDSSKALNACEATNDKLQSRSVEVIDITDEDCRGQEKGPREVVDTEEVIEIDDDEKVEKKGDNEEEDVPGDFFDDFLKEDFMAGLDIVDEDDEGDEEKHKRGWTDEKKQIDKKSKHNTEIVSASLEKISKKKKTSIQNSPTAEAKDHSKNEIKKVLKKHDKELKKLDAELERIRKVKVSKSKQSKTSIDIDEFDIRRDPEKTKRDIQRDKEKCEKDREKKILEEKLGLVETGLVPPGMEMEVDLEEIKRQERIERNRPPGDLRERLRSLRSKSKERRNRSEEKTTSDTSAKRRRSASPRKKDVINPKRSPQIRKERSPRRSPISNRVTERKEASRRRRLTPEIDVSLLKHKTSVSRTSPRHRSPRQSPPRRPPFRSRSPRRRSRSPRRRSPYRRSRSPEYRRPMDRSSPLRRRRDRSFSPMDRRRPLRREEKKSFLEELVEKLNEPRKDMLATRPYLPIAPVPSGVAPLIPSIPSNVSQQFFTPQQPLLTPLPAANNTYDPYDASFFIGHSVPLPSVGATGYAGNQLGRSDNRNSKYDDIQVKSKEDISKLFQDKKISLSEFLAMTKKPEEPAPSSAKLKEKIKVLQRCQEALRVLESMENSFGGRLVVRKTDIYEPSMDKTRSPLLRYPEVKLPFTTPSEDTTEISFSKHCQQLLKAIGIDEQVTVTKEDIASVRIPSKSNVTPVSLPPAPIHASHSSYTGSVHPKMTQTDPKLSECHKCKARREIEYFSLGVQCGTPQLTYSVSTQVSEADFYSMIPKTQSLATLTPAQLLGKSTQSKISQGSLVKSLESFMALRPDSFGASSHHYGGPQVGPPPPPAPPSLLDMQYMPNNVRPPYQNPAPGALYSNNSANQQQNRYGGYGRF